jgi:signal peptidase I
MLLPLGMVEPPTFEAIPEPERAACPAEVGLGAIDVPASEVPAVEIAAPPPEAQAVCSPRRYLPSVRRGVFFAMKLGAAIIALTAARASLADQYQVPTGSMAPTIEPGDRIFVDKMAYDIRLPFSDRVVVDRRGPAVGDLVILIDPRDGETTLVKRVVALAGQTVAMRRGTLFVDEAPQRLDRLDDGQLVERLGTMTHAEGERDLAAYGPFTVPPDHVFVMGDNRAVSLDSRVIGPIPRNWLLP